MQANNVVFTQVVAALDFNEHQVIHSQIGNAMGGTYRNINGLTNLYNPLIAVQGDPRAPLDDNPVFLPPHMPLITHPLARQDFNAFDFVSRPQVKNGVLPPRTCLAFQDATLSFVIVVCHQAYQLLA